MVEILKVFSLNIEYFIHYSSHSGRCIETYNLHNLLFSIPLPFLLQNLAICCCLKIFGFPCCLRFSQKFFKWTRWFCLKIQFVRAVQKMKIIMVMYPALYQTTFFPTFESNSFELFVRVLGMSTEVIFDRMTRVMMEVLSVKFLFHLPTTFLLVE